MGQLTHAERDALLRPYVLKTKITETYRCVANLVGGEFVDVVYNVNFDHLAEDSLRRAEVRTWTYDIADSLHYQPGRTQLPALLYLHGKFGGFNNIHTPDGMKAVLQRVVDVLKEHLSSRALIVIGYSGLADPVFDALVNTFKEFDHGLYWVSLQTQPAPHVVTGLLADHNKQAQFIGGIDSDSFFRKLSTCLELPQLLQFRDPLAYLVRSFEAFAPALTQEPRRRLSDIVRSDAPRYHQMLAGQGTGDEIELNARVRSAWDRQDFEALTDLTDAAGSSGDEETRSLVSFGLYNRGTARAAEALRRAASERYEGLLEAREDLTLAAALNPKLLQAYLNLGLVLERLAELPITSEAERAGFLKDAHGHYETAAALAPALSDPFEGLARVHTANARAESDGPSRLAHLKAAASLYWRAVYNDRHDHRLQNNWGLVLKDIADESEGTPARRAYEEASERFRRAVVLEPDSPNAYYNWALTLHGFAHRSSPDETLALLEQASQKYMEAIRLAPGKFEASYNRGVVFMDIQRTAGITKSARRDWLGQACEMFRLSTEVNPKLYEGFYNWGNALLIRHSIVADGSETDDLASAVGKLTEATKLRPNSSEAHNNLGVALTLLAAAAGAAEDGRHLYLKAIAELRLARTLLPSDPKTLRALGDSLQQLARLQPKADAKPTFEEALRVYDELLNTQPNEPAVYTMKSNVWLGLAHAEHGNGRDRALAEAERLARHAEGLRYGSGVYNLACAAALAGRAAEAFELLETALRVTEETRAHVETDVDLDNLKRDPRWVQLLGKYRPRPSTSG
jgi:tetratricopeptide (TPR) repeat protein